MCLALNPIATMHNVLKLITKSNNSIIPVVTKQSTVRIFLKGKIVPIMNFVHLHIPISKLKFNCYTS